MADLVEVMDLLDLSVARSEGFVSEDVAVELADTAKRVRTRNGFVGEVLAVALAGGTGSGKSSLLNALAGEELVTTGIVRPTTQHATAILPPESSVDLQPLMDSLGVDDHIIHDRFDSFIVVDLPDFDSTAEAHRHVVEEVLPRVDVVVWVLDPEKYGDPLLHNEFLAPLATYGDQFIFVLNQIDRLADQTEAALDALRGLLVSDGFDAPVVVPAASAPRHGEVDVSEVEHALESSLDTKTAAVAKIALDIRRLASQGHAASLAADRSDVSAEQLDGIAYSAATFVSLGVAAYDLHHRTTDA